MVLTSQLSLISVYLPSSRLRAVLTVVPTSRADIPAHRSIRGYLLMEFVFEHSCQQHGPAIVMALYITFRHSDYIPEEKRRKRKKWRIPFLANLSPVRCVSKDLIRRLLQRSHFMGVRRKINRDKIGVKWHFLNYVFLLRTFYRHKLTSIQFVSQALTTFLIEQIVFLQKQISCLLKSITEKKIHWKIHLLAFP